MRQQEQPASDRELDVQSFIIKLRPEGTGGGRGARLLRGSITHVPSGERRSIKSMDGIVDFIIPYLETMQVSLGSFWWFRRWRRKLQRRLGR